MLEDIILKLSPDISNQEMVNAHDTFTKRLVGSVSFLGGIFLDTGNDRGYLPDRKITL